LPPIRSGQRALGELGRGYAGRAAAQKRQDDAGRGRRRWGRDPPQDGGTHGSAAATALRRSAQTPLGGFGPGKMLVAGVLGRGGRRGWISSGDWGWMDKVVRRRRANKAPRSTTRAKERSSVASRSPATRSERLTRPVLLRRFAKQLRVRLGSRCSHQERCRGTTFANDDSRGGVPRSRRRRAHASACRTPARSRAFRKGDRFSARSGLIFPTIRERQPRQAGSGEVIRGSPDRLAHVSSSGSGQAGLGLGLAWAGRLPDTFKEQHAFVVVMLRGR